MPSKQPQVGCCRHPVLLYTPMFGSMSSQNAWKPQRANEVLVSSGIEPYLSDFSVLVSFALNCVFTPDIDLTRRLISEQRGLATRTVPQTLVRRFFDRDIWCKPEELKFLEELVEKIIGLPRHTFSGRHAGTSNLRQRNATPGLPMTWSWPTRCSLPSVGVASPRL